ncbi:E3 ubiquitin-protein ligase TTC3-like, partial [Actinia tenebrosa]|uniref:E3 ubiquitin-protein ligase TTC3-like n=1 Tax=Actinia tenebrosa TaxID=6105 RepID=A0A6P8IHS3_ACTTE
MPSSPRKRPSKTRAKPKKVREEDSDTDSSMPSLVDSSDSDDETKGPRLHHRKAVSNAESVEMWLDLSKASRERHTRVMKIYLLSPFLFDVVEQEDKWINWAHECNLLPTKKNIDPSLHIQECMEAVDIIEDAFNNVTKYLLAKEDSDETEKALGMMDKVNALDKLDNAIVCAESFNIFLKIREHIKTAHLKKKGDSKRKGDTSLLLALQQMYDHIRKLTRDNKDLTKQFEDTCRQNEQQSIDMKKKGNTHFMDGKYKAAISAYTKAILMSQYSYILYGNRAQSYLRTKETWQALFDGRRSVVLKPDWAKGQYRYAQAYFELGLIDEAISTNREAKIVCTRDSKDLDFQYEKFLKEKNKEIQARKTAKVEKHQTKANIIDGIPDLVDADTSDTSGDSDDDIYDDDDDMMSSSDETDSDGEDVPELVTDSSRESDSDDAIPIRKNQDNQMKKQLAEKPQVNQVNGAVQPEMKKRKRKERDKKEPDQAKRKEALEVTEGPQKRRDLTFALKQGSKAYLDGKVKASVRYYGEAFEMLSLENAFEIFKIKSIDYILILYAHGTACLETGIYKELLEATKQFETIIVKYKDIKFPLAFYGLGKVFRRQNKFSEALQPLNQGFNMVRCGEEYGEYRWPGTQTIIEETKPGKLKVAFEDIISRCQHPPRPDAICRYNECNGGKINIYLSDPDYKGYVRLICDESCKIEYHPNCWKKYKSNYGDSNADKDYLERVCLTPDCGAPVVGIQIYGTSGLKTEFVPENVKAKQKQVKQNKVKAHGNQKQPKGEKQRKEKEEVKADNIKKDMAEQENKDPAPNNIKEKTKPAEEPEEKEVHKTQCAEPQQLIKDTRVVDTGVYILRKGEERMQDDLGCYLRGAKGKGKKKKKNVQSLDEFLNDGQGEGAKQPTVATVKEEDEEKPENFSSTVPNSPFAIPLHLQSDVQAFEKEYRAAVDPKATTLTAPKDTPPPKEKTCVDPIEDYMYSLFKETLNAHGPLDVGDARMIEPISFLPETHQQKIQECGGIKQFLMKSEQFVVQGNVVMLPDELHFQEIVKNVNKYITQNKPSIRTLNSSAMEHDFLQDDNIGQFNGNGTVHSSNTSLRKSPLNPEVREFIPSEPSSCESLQVGDVSPIKDLSKDNAICSENVEDDEETSNLSQEGTVKGRGSDLLKLLSNMEQSGSPWKQKKSDVLEGSKTLSGNGSEMLSKLDVFRDCSDETLELKKPTGTKTTTQGSNGENLTPQEGGGRESLSPPEGSDQKTLSSLVAGNLDNLLPLVGGSRENLSAINGQVQDTESKNRNWSPTLSTPVKYKRVENSGSETTIGCKSKGVQTQLQTKAKGIMTDSQPEPFKVEYQKMTQEKDEISRKLQDATEKLNSIQERHTQELERMKKRFTDIQTEREKLQKELQSSKQEGESELKRLGETCEEKVKLANSLEEHFRIERDRYQATIAGLQKELTEAKDELSNEKTKFNTSLAQKEELIKKANTLKQQQETRAQDAEVKLLELRRDVGLRFLERAMHEAHLTINNLLEALKTSANSKLEELTAIWKSYANDCRQKIIQCNVSEYISYDGKSSGKSHSSQVKAWLIRTTSISV